MTGSATPPLGEPLAGRADERTGTITIDPAVRDLDRETHLLREAGPIARVDLLGAPAWSVTRHAEARRLLTDPRLVKDINRWKLWRTGEVTRDWPLIGMIDATRSMFTVDGAEHRRLRAKAAQAITPRRVQRLRPVVESTCRELLDDLAEQGSCGPVDLKAVFARPLPMTVICVLMGVDPDLRPRLRTLYEAFFSLLTPQAERLAVMDELDALFVEMVRTRTAAPADDLTSALILAEQGGVPLTAEEVVGTLKAMIAAGHETTISLILNTVRALLAHPDQLRDVLADRVGWGPVIAESLRWEPSATHLLMRFATEDIEVGDALVREGDGVVLSYRAIGRDVEWHGPDADEFDVRRSTADKHLSFGHGPHICPGAALATLEAETALPALFERFPNLQLAVPAEEIRNLPVLTQNDIAALPVQLHGG